MEVDKENVDFYLGDVLRAVESADFVAVDLEFSGLAPRSSTFEQQLQQRYDMLRPIVEGQGVLQVGLCCLKRMPPSPNVNAQTDRSLPQAWEAIVINLTTVPVANFDVSPGSFKFLADSGLNLSEVFQKGIPYTAGRPRPDEPLTPVRQIMSQVVRSNLVFHNGFADMMHLYHCFVDALPRKLGNFVAAWDEMSTSIHDTKHIHRVADLRWNASYLDYLYHKLSRSNASLNPPQQIQVHQLPPPPPPPPSPPPPKLEPGESPICANYAKHGNCPQGAKCVRSHDIETILDVEMAKRQQKAKNKRKRSSSTASQPPIARPASPSRSSSLSHASTLLAPWEPVNLGQQQEDTNAVPAVADTAATTAAATAPSNPSSPSLPVPLPAPPAPESRTLASSNVPSSVTPVHAPKSVQSASNSMNTTPSSTVAPSRLRMHSAGHDAWATACVFVWLRQRLARAKEEQCRNAVFLMGKQVPLRIVTSQYTKKPSGHAPSRSLAMAEAQSKVGPASGVGSAGGGHQAPLEEGEIDGEDLGEPV